ncbi:Ribonuclease TUDOR 1 [Camellia lanceoleosa]|uniref:Ribonuclease TUDOR 1 n=1 Tax=Camellia lanceoleosa TaxID=1840588 RepID=A0ACC0F9N5_9ERIC|nr:Ribonuclease TUDOR 1 [Camellia lanceoleosa]
MDEETPLVAEHLDFETLTKSLLVDFLGSWCYLELGEYYQKLGKVKTVPSGDSLVIIGSTKAEIPPGKTITLSSLIARRLARRCGVAKPFAWESREYLRKLCMGNDVTFKVDYIVPSIGQEFGFVFLGDKNVALMVVSDGWVKVQVKEQGQQKGDASPFLAELLRLEEPAKQQGLGCWTRCYCPFFYKLCRRFVLWVVVGYGVPMKLVILL